MAGRSVIQVEVSHPGGRETWPGVAFAGHHGYRLAMRERHSVLALPVPAERLGAMPVDGYTLRSWRDHCPDELVDGYCRLRERFEGEVRPQRHRARLARPGNAGARRPLE